MARRPDWSSALREAAVVAALRDDGLSIERAAGGFEVSAGSGAAVRWADAGVQRRVRADVVSEVAPFRLRGSLRGPVLLDGAWDSGDPAAPVPGGDAHRRLVLLSAAARRIDRRLVRTVPSSAFDDVVEVLGPDDAPSGSARVLRAARPVEVLGLLGPETTVLVPETVSAAALVAGRSVVPWLIAAGVRVICPRILWPTGVGIDAGFLLDFGADLHEAFDDWVRRPAPPTAADPTAAWSSRCRPLIDALRERLS